MVLPKSLLARYDEELSFYSCTVSNFEQYTLAKFIEKGHLEKHINRMRNYYRNLRDTMLSCIKNEPGYPYVTILEEDSGLHFLLKVNTKMHDNELIAAADAQGIHISCLNQYYALPPKEDSRTIIINYSGIRTTNITESITRLFKAIK